MNTIVAQSIDYCATKLEAATDTDPDTLHRAVQELLTEVINECEPIIFNGDGYSKQWHTEAAERGLLNLKTTVDALPYLQSPEVLELFRKYEVLSERELESRLETYLEQYCMTVKVEANLMIEMARTMIFPASIRYQGELASTCVNLQLVGYEFDTDTLDTVTSLVKSLQGSIASLDMAMTEDETDDLVDKARHYCDVVLPAMGAVRQFADALEGLVADDIWPLPTYQEMLFIK